ncbi:hypothetical protein F9K97_10845 [Brucella anthropi]|nr:hypothetical protein F9K97_10845 [Brucella anthropi]
MIQALRDVCLFENTPAQTGCIFKQDATGTKFFQKPVGPTCFQIGTNIINVMEACCRAPAGGLQVVHMIIHPRDLGLEQSFESFFRNQYTSRVLCNFIKHKIELAGHVACLSMIRLFEAESKVTRTNIASQMCRKARTPVKNISAPLKILNLMSDCHDGLAVWSHETNRPGRISMCHSSVSQFCAQSAKWKKA